MFPEAHSFLFVFLTEGNAVFWYPHSLSILDYENKNIFGIKFGKSENRYFAHAFSKQQQYFSEAVEM